MSLKKLFNSFVEFVVVSGCDRDTGLSNSASQIGENTTVSELTNQLFSICFEPSILSVINFDTAYYPSKKSSKLNFAYPPVKISKESNEDSNQETAKNKSRRSSQRRTSLIESPIQIDILKNLSQFCFPKNVNVSKINSEPSIHSFVLTDIEGRKKFAVVLTYNREFYCCETESNTYELVEVNDQEDITEEKKNYALVYVPTSIVLISKFFYYNLLKTCLSSMYNDLVEKPQDFSKIIEDYAYELTNIPVPPISSNRFNLILEYSLSFKDIIIYPLDEHGFEIFDLDISIVFIKFNMDTLLKIILCILSESKIVFMSRSIGLLTPIIQIFFKLIFPFKWLLPYVPLLPCSQLEYLEAPHPFIMGIDADLVYRIDQNNEVVIINIDNGTIAIPDSIKLHMFPFIHLEQLKQRLNLVDFNYVQHKKLTSPSLKDWKGYLSVKKNLVKQQNTQILDAFMEFYVNLFGDLFAWIKVPTKTFNKKKYLESQNETYLEFYKQIVETSLFDFFMNELIDNFSTHKNDSYYEKLQEIKTNLSEDILNLTVDERRRRSKSRSSLVYISTRPFFKSFQMPKFSTEFFYPNECIKKLTEEIEKSNMLAFQDSLLYLRGLFYFSANKIKESFHDFYSIDSKDIFPIQLIEDEVWPSMTLAQKEQIKEEKYYKNSFEFKKIENQQESMPKKKLAYQNSVDILLLDEYESLTDLSFNDFTKKLDKLEIRVDTETVQRLWDALTLSSSHLNMSSFEIFIDTYTSKEDELQKVYKYLPVTNLRITEYALKLSNSIVVPRIGIGRIVLTQKNLYFLEQGTNKRKLLIEIQNIKLIDKERYQMFKDAIKITAQNDATIYLPFQEERNLWFILLNELLSATNLSKEYKDNSLINMAAKNILLIDCVCQSGYDPRTKHSEDLHKAIDNLIYYSKYEEDEDLNDTKQILHLRLKPTSRGDENYSIETMLYVSKDDTLWLGFGNHIKIYEMESITLSNEIDDFKLDDKITCLKCDSNEDKIWIGTIDSCITVMDINTRSIYTKIKKHSDVIVSIEIFQKFNYILSASSNSQIGVWNTDKLELNYFFNLKELDKKEFDKKRLAGLMTSKELIICNISSCLLILDEKFKLKEKLMLTLSENKTEQINCISISFNDESNEEFIWAGNASNGIVCIWSLKSFDLKMRLYVDDCKGYRVFLNVNDSIWAGSKDGKLSVFCTKTLEYEKTFQAHSDTIRSLCFVDKYKFVVSGAGSKDGTIAVWFGNRISKKTIMSSIKKLMDFEIVNSNY